MNNTKEIAFIIKVMLGGGAERVISLLSKAVAERGLSVTLILTHQKLSDAVLKDIDANVKVVSLPDKAEESPGSSFLPRMIMIFARLIGKISHLITKKDSQKSLILKYLSRNYAVISQLKKYFKSHKNSCAVAFLYDSIFITLLAAQKNNRIIISERGDPEQSSASKTVAAFMKKEFPKADATVFQSPDAKRWYKDHTPVDGTVIFNPIKSDLPEPFAGKRKKRIVNFCRVSEQKNLIMLIDAFSLFGMDFPDYELFIFGDPVGNTAEGYMDSVKEKIGQSPCKERIHLFPSRNDIHSEIRDYAMFVSSSDFEGMSNSMLEAMALGLPCVCTDCPAGGARAVIRNGENGLLVPVGDAEKTNLAMKELAENPALANKLSENSVKIKEEQSVKNIIEKWMEIING